MNDVYAAILAGRRSEGLGIRAPAELVRLVELPAGSNLDYTDFLEKH